MKKSGIKLLVVLFGMQSGIALSISASNAKALRLNIQLNAIQYAKKDKALKIAKNLLKHDKKNVDLEQVSLQVLSRPGTDEATRKVLMQVYLKQNKLIGNEKNLPKDLIKAARVTGGSLAMSTALQNLGLKAYPQMVKALQCKKTRRRKKSNSKYPVAQQALADAISGLVKANINSKAVKKSTSRLVKCFKCAGQNTALACGRALSQFKKLDNSSVRGLGSILVSHKDKQRKIAAARMLVRYSEANKQSKRALEVGVKSRNELTRLTSASVLYSKFRDHHGAKKALEKLGKSSKNASYRKQALQALKADQ